MLKVKRFDYIYIAVHKDYKDYMNEQVKKNIPESEKVRVILGGKERMDTINNVTTAITMITEFMMTMLSLSTMP